MSTFRLTAADQAEVVHLQVDVTAEHPIQGYGPKNYRVGCSEKTRPATYPPKLLLVLSIVNILSLIVGLHGLELVLVSE